MDEYVPPRYTIELWHRGKTKVADITRLCQDIDWSMTRNGVESLDFNMSMPDWEEKCRRIGENPNTILKPWVSDIRVKRNGEYLFGAVVVEANRNLNTDNARILVQCDGYLNLIDARYLNGRWKGIEATDIAWDIIQEVQNRPNGDVGITRGSRQYRTGVRRDRMDDWEDINAKDALVSLTNLQDGKFDFRFTYDRKFETFQTLGNERPDVTVHYPDDGLGIGAIRMELPQSGANLYNNIIGKASGMGEETIRYSAEDVLSQQEFILREKVQLSNSIKNLSTLAGHCEADVSVMSRLVDLPRVTVRGTQFDLNNIGVGDRIVVQQSKYSSCPLSGYYRIEQLSVKVDENMSEEITLTLDNYDL